jgi:hypothetical protein
MVRKIKNVFIFDPLEALEVQEPTGTLRGGCCEITSTYRRTESRI